MVKHHMIHQLQSSSLNSVSRCLSSCPDLDSIYRSSWSPLYQQPKIFLCLPPGIRITSSSFSVHFLILVAHIHQVLSEKVEIGMKFTLIYNSTNVPIPCLCFIGNLVGCLETFLHLSAALLSVLCPTV